MAKDDEIFDLDNLDKGISKITNLISILNEADAELVNLSKNALAASKALGGISTPGGLGKSQGENAKTLAELDKLKKKYADLEAQIKKLNETRKQTEKLNFQEKIDARIRLQNETAQAKAVSDEADAYQKLASKLALAQKNAQAIGAQFGADSAQFKKASDSIKKLDDEIKKIDAGIGKHQRNVGNYASGWNGLGNSINQITREAPAAAVSMNTFFLAISNNLPMFFDELGKLKAANVELAKSGQPVKSVMKEVFSAFFSWQTLMSLSVTLLTLFGGKIIELISGMGNLDEQLKKITAQQEKYNHRLEDINRNIEHNLVLEKNRRKLLGETEKDLMVLDKEAALQKLKNFETVRDANKKALDDRIKFLIKDKDLSFTNYTYQIGISEKLKSDQLRLEKEYNKAIRENAYGKDKATRDNAGASAVQLRKKLSVVNKAIIADNALTQDEIFMKRQEGFIKANNEAVLYGQQVSELFSNLAVQEKESDEDRLADLAEMNRKEIELMIAKNDVLLNDEDAYYSDRITALEKDKKLRERLSELDYAEELRLAKNSYEKQQTALLNFKIDNLKILQDYSKKLDELEKLDLDSITQLVDVVKEKDLFKSMTDSAKEAGKELEKAGIKAEKTRLSILKLQSATKAWLSSFSSDALSNAGLDSIQIFFDDTFKNLLKGAEGSKEKFAVYFNAIAESAQQAFNFITSISQKNFDGEKERLQNQYDTALKYTGDNKAAQEKLALDLEKSKKDIAYREAKAKQRQAIFNIAIDTAQGVVSALASTPPNIILSAIIAGIGIAQIAAVSSQEIPRYFKGGTHDGGLMMVNDAPGSNFRETIVTPDGKVTKPTGRNVIMNAPAGTEIFTESQWNDQMNNMLKGNGILWDMPNQYNSGLSKEDLEDVMVRTLASQSKQHNIWDRKGFGQYIEKGGNITRGNINRGNSHGTIFK